MTRLRLLPLALLLAVPVWAPAANAVSSSITLGQVSPSPNFSCAVPNSPILQFETQGLTPPYTVPGGGGVIVKWSNAARSGNGQQLKFKVWRPNPTEPNFLAVGESELRDIEAAELNTFATRIPVQQGDRIGLVTGPNAATNAPDCLYDSDSFSDVVYDRGPNSDFPLGQSDVFIGPTFKKRVNVQVTLEGDEDKDGFGDITQDGCPTNAALQGPCTPFGGGGGAPPPSNSFSFGKVSSSKNGTASVAVNVPGPGRLVASDAGASASSSARKKALINRASKTATKAGSVRLALKPSKTGKKRLRRSGRLSVKVKISFTPTGGSSASKTKRVKFRRG